MLRARVASFNVKNLIGPEQEYYKFQQYTEEEYAWKSDWLAEQLVTMDADIVGFQEIFEEAALRDVIEAADEIGQESNEVSVPDRSKRYRKRAIFRKLSYTGYDDAALAFAPNVNDGVRGIAAPALHFFRALDLKARPRLSKS